MIRRVIQCDTCKKQADIPDPPYAWPAPERWLTLAKGDPMEKQPWHFCSEDCLWRWQEQRFATSSMDLTPDQKVLILAWRDEHVDFTRAFVELFEKEHPDLHLIWSMTIDAKLSEVEVP